MNNKFISLFFVALALTTTAMSMTPLHVVAYTGRADYISPIVQSGIPVDIKDLKNRSPLNYAACQGHLECVRKLLDLGANVFAQDYIGATPLHHAALQGNSTVVNLLMEHRTKRKEQLLQDFADCEDKTFVTELITAETAIDIKDIKNGTPLHCAALTGSITCVKILVKHGANVHALTNLGSSPKDLAVFAALNPNIIVAIRKGNLINEVNHLAVIAYLERKMAEKAHQ